MGFRDSCQDLLGFVHLIPDRARQRILDIAATQFEDGSAYHQYQPLTKKGNSDIGSGFNDDPLWLIAGTAAYIKETGDLSILDEMVDFNNDSALAKPLSEHLKRSFDGLEIGPCIPSNMDGFTATRKYRNAVYYITVKYPNHVEEVMG